MTCSQVEALVAMVIQNFHDSLRDFLASGPSRREKHLEKFLKFFVSKVFGDLFVTWFNRENRMFCTIRVFFKTGFKNCVALFWQLGYGSIQSQAYIEGFRDSLAGQCPNHEKDLENFPNFWVFTVLATQFGNLFMSGSSNREVIQKFLWLPSRLTREWTFQS